VHEGSGFEHLGQKSRIDPEPARTVRPIVIEATASLCELAAINLSAADEWQVVVTFRGTPCAVFNLPSPGSTSGPGLAVAAIARRAASQRDRQRLVETIERRMGAPRGSQERRTCSVVVCTHRRPRQLGALFTALGALDPAPDEVVIVDNDPGDLDCRVEAERVGAKYVREDRRGLDNARNAGMRAARGEIVAFTDDDCRPAIGWLRSLPELFGDPTVASVTGPAFAYSLSSEAQREFERSGGFGRGLNRRHFDWTNLPPTNSSRAGAGANMIFRASVLRELGDPFPPELDAGTPTESGGDMYVLYRVLASGWRVVYDPATYVFHEHREDAESLRRTIRGYGIGISAVLTKLLIEDRELSTPATWWWLVEQYVQTGLGRVTGRLDHPQLQIAGDYLYGGFLGPRAWRRALRAANRQSTGGPPGGERAARGLGARDPVRDTRASAPRLPSVSVIVPTIGRPDALRRCLDALAPQSPGASVEVIVVDDSPDGRAALTVSGPRHGDGAIRVEKTGGAGAAAARNAGVEAAGGDVLLFLDDDLVPSHDLVARHQVCHRGDSERIVIGYSPPCPTRESLVGSLVSLWWEDHFQHKRRAAALTFSEVLTGNMSVPRATFTRIGTFDPAFATFRREDWDWGVRALQAGVEVVYACEAVATHHFSTDTRDALEKAYLEGRGDALLVSRHPSTLPTLPAWGLRASSLSVQLAAALLGRGSVRRVAVPLLDCFERAKFRRSWMRLWMLTRLAAYVQGFHDGGAPRPSVPTMPVELTSNAPLPRPRVAAPALELRVRDRPVGRVAAEDGHWDASLAEQVASTLVEEAWRELPRGSETPLEDTPAGRDLSGATVLFGPGRAAGDDRHSAGFEAAGARVETVGGSLGNHWAALDQAIRSSSARVVGVPFPGVAPEPAWLAGVKIVLDGERVAVAVGAGLRRAESRWPATLHARSEFRFPYPPLGAPSQYVAVRPELYRRLGGFDTAAAYFGPHGPVLDLIQRALDSGFVVGCYETVGLSPPAPSRSRVRRFGEWRRWRAKGGLAMRDALELGGGNAFHRFLREGAAPVALILAGTALRGWPPPRASVGRATAFAAGCLAAIRMRASPASRTVNGPRRPPKLEA
jgi:GT2 family glycosyltransferase